MSAELAYLIFVPVAALCFARLSVRNAILLVMIGGWWLLPVGKYPPFAEGRELPWWITGIALPSDMLLTKAWVPPLVAFVGAVFCAPAALRIWRPSVIDLPMALWCVWPLFAGFGRSADPAPWISTLYIAGAWGLLWLIGRVWLLGSEGNIAIVRALALSGLANLPIAIIEGLRPAMLYGLVYGQHPYQSDGVGRYIGYRPIGFLEHGNLFGLWAALAALAAIWLAIRSRESGSWDRWGLLVFLNLAVALASQSVGAILLLGMGVALLAIWRRPLFMATAAGVVGLLSVIGMVHISAVVPLQSIARSPAGVRAIHAMRATGRGSFLWRISQDTKTLPGILASPVAGSSHWDWWRPFNTRPWGQPLLVLGQFGLIGLLLAWGALLSAVVAAFARLRTNGFQTGADAALPLAVIILLALTDAALNAFFFFPAILAAGAIATGRPAHNSRRGPAP